MERRAHSLILSIFPERPSRRQHGTLESRHYLVFGAARAGVPGGAERVELAWTELMRERKEIRTEASKLNLRFPTTPGLPPHHSSSRNV